MQSFGRVNCTETFQKSFARTRFVDAARIVLTFGDAPMHLAEYMITLRLVVFNKVTTLPDGVAHVTEGFGLQTKSA